MVPVERKLKRGVGRATNALIWVSDIRGKPIILRGWIGFFILIHSELPAKSPERTLVVRLERPSGAEGGEGLEAGASRTRATACFAVNSGVRLFLELPAKRGSTFDTW